MTESSQSSPLCQVGWVTSKESGEVRRVVCGRWLCPRCGPRRQRELARRLRPAGFSRLITFTQRPGAGHVSRETLHVQAKAWRGVKQWLTRSARLRSFVWVRERGGATGRLHLHVLVESDYVPWRALRAACKRAGFGVVVDVRRARGPRASAYVLKYLSKCRERWPRYTRRVQTNVPRPPFDAGAWEFEAQYQWAAQSAAEPADVAERQGAKVGEQLTLIDCPRKSASCGAQTRPKCGGCGPPKPSDTSAVDLRRLEEALDRFIEGLEANLEGDPCINR